jgi:hypothetical protein
MAASAKRKELEDMADRIKRGPEAEAKEALLRILKDQGQMSAKLPDGLGTVSRTVKRQVRLADAEAFCEHMFRSMERARRADPDAPLVDHLLTVKQPLKNENLRWAEQVLEETGLVGEEARSLENMNKALAERGLSLYQVEDVVHTKARS